MTTHDGCRADKRKARETTPRPWPENTEPTAEQLADWLKVCTDDERLTFAAKALYSVSAAERCFIENHAARIEQARAGEGALRERIEALTVEFASLVPVRRLRAALDAAGDQP